MGQQHNLNIQDSISEDLSSQSKDSFMQEVEKEVARQDKIDAMLKRNYRGGNTYDDFLMPESLKQKILDKHFKGIDSEEEMKR